MHFDFSNFLSLVSVLKQLNFYFGTIHAARVLLALLLNLFLIVIALQWFALLNFRAVFPKLYLFQIITSSTCPETTFPVTYSKLPCRIFLSKTLSNFLHINSSIAQRTASVNFPFISKQIFRLEGLSNCNIKLKYNRLV